MSEDLVTPSKSSLEGDTTDNQKLTASQAIHEDVKEAIASSNPMVRQNVIDQLTNTEIEKRSKAVLAAVDKVVGFRREQSKIRPTYLGKTLKGEPVGEAIYTDEQVKQNKKLSEDIQKYENAIAKALDSGDYQKLYELAGGSQ